MALNTLALDYICYPCPRETLVHYGVVLNSRFRPDAKKSGGVLMFPYLVDMNTEVRMYNSSDIVDYLWTVYGSHARKPLPYRIVTSKLYCSVAEPLLSLLRPCIDMGIIRAPSKKPNKALELWGNETSPVVKRVRELLTTLEVPHIMHVMPWGSENRIRFREKYGKRLSLTRRKLGLCKIPFLVDSNTGTELFESSAICAYIKNTYQLADVDKKESWRYFGCESTLRDENSTAGGSNPTNPKEPMEPDPFPGSGSKVAEGERERDISYDSLDSAPFAPQAVTAATGATTSPSPSPSFNGPLKDAYNDPQTYTHHDQQPPGGIGLIGERVIRAVVGDGEPMIRQRNKSKNKDKDRHKGDKAGKPHLGLKHRHEESSLNEELRRDETGATEGR